MRSRLEILQREKHSHLADRASMLSWQTTTTTPSGQRARSHTHTLHLRVARAAASGPRTTGTTTTRRERGDSAAAEGRATRSTVPWSISRSVQERYMRQVTARIDIRAWERVGARERERGHSSPYNVGAWSRERRGSRKREKECPLASIDSSASE